MKQHLPSRGDTRPSRPSVRPAASVLIGLILALTCVPAAVAEVPEPDNIFWGVISLGNTPVTAADTNVIVEARRTLNGPALASYRLGTAPAFGDFYSIQVPVESYTPLVATNASGLGASIVLTVSDANGIRASREVALPSRGRISRVDFGAIDGDSNGLPDDWERFYFGNAGNDAAADPDGDGVNTGQELLNGTDPTVADTRHPADLNPVNNSLTIHEITAYAAAWKLGQAWPVAPTNIDLNFVTRAGFLWKNGEEYRVNLTAATNAPLWWVPGPQNRAVAPRALRPVEGTGELTRALPRSFTPGEPVTVTLETAPSSQVSCHAIEERIPAGWNVSEISSGGVLDATNRVIRWGLFFDAETRSLSYTLTPATATDLAEFHGDGSFDGWISVTAGRNLLTRFGYAKLVILPGANAAVGGRIELQGEPAGDYVLEVSEDLVHWQELARQTADEAGRTEFSETGAGAQRFYRARVLVK